MSIFQNRTVAIATGATIIALAGSTGAVAANLVNSADIRDNSIRTVDVRDGSLRVTDLNGATRRSFNNSGVIAEINDLQTRLAELESEDASGVNTNWVAGDGATIDGKNSVTVKNEGTPTGSSVEILNLNLPVQATKTIEFTYEAVDGAVYGGGSPRVFIEIDGVYLNTHDAEPADAGVPNGDGTFTKSWTIPTNGRVGNAGVVMDSGAGSFTITDLVISGHAVSFQ